MINKSVVSRLDAMIQDRARDDIYVMDHDSGEWYVYNFTQGELLLDQLPNRDTADIVCNGMNYSDVGKRAQLINAVKNIWNRYSSRIHRYQQEIAHFEKLAEHSKNVIHYHKLHHSEQGYSTAVSQLQNKLSTVFMLNRKRSSL